jgi:Ser/Thr protein kinase RdoA (MazF antagonist)
MESFNQLSRIQKRIRLRKLGRKALCNFGIDRANLKLISDTTNFVFRVDTMDSRFVLRVDPDQPDGDRASMQSEEQLWLSSIRNDTNLQVPTPVQAQDGAMVQLTSTPELPEGRLVTLLHWMPGKLVGKRPSKNMMQQLGVFMSGLHKHTENFSLPAGSVRTDIDWSTRLNYWQDSNNDGSNTLTGDQRELCAFTSEFLLRDILRIGCENHYGLIHADMHVYNCLRDDGELKVIDFDDCCIASHFYDMAVPLTYLDDRKDYLALKESFYGGYLRTRSLPENFDSHVETFMVARAFDMVEWIHYCWPDLESFPEGQKLLDAAIRRIEKYRITCVITQWRKFSFRCLSAQREVFRSVMLSLQSDHCNDRCSRFARLRCRRRCCRTRGDHRLECLEVSGRPQAGCPWSRRLDHGA